MTWMTSCSIEEKQASGFWDFRPESISQAAAMALEIGRGLGGELKAPEGNRGVQG